MGPLLENEITLAGVGAIVGDNLGYWAGRLRGRPLLERLGSPLARRGPRARAHPALVRGPRRGHDLRGARHSFAALVYLQ
ncbi:MAG TPA: hypothetical protein VL948_24165 [Verrucomicrobiae bacterium]|nr:hypothetical protein [Verrucomicrobiae bacterium]